VKPLDVLLQNWRVDKARPWIPDGARVLDIGCADGPLFRRLGARLQGGVGIDPDLGSQRDLATARLYPGWFPKDLPPCDPFDAITMLAVLEHVPPDQHYAWGTACARLLKPGGRLIVTVPSPAVDRILGVLGALRLIDGMSLHQHYGFDPARTPAIFAPHGLRLLTHASFQLGLNHLFVLEPEP
jgi:2-polyprenyl-3-methyl-5-hydroxy-6-metoxy-1,4-benzoquinol methylase